MRDTYNAERGGAMESSAPFGLRKLCENGRKLPVFGGAVLKF